MKPWIKTFAACILFAIGLFYFLHVRGKYSLEVPSRPVQPVLSATERNLQREQSWMEIVDERDGFVIEDSLQFRKLFLKETKINNGALVSENTVIAVRDTLTELAISLAVSGNYDSMEQLFEAYGIRTKPSLVASKMIPRMKESDYLLDWRKIIPEQEIRIAFYKSSEIESSIAGRDLNVWKALDIQTAPNSAVAICSVPVITADGKARRSFFIMESVGDSLVFHYAHGGYGLDPDERIVKKFR